MPDKLNREASNDSGEFSASSSVPVSEPEKEVLDLDTQKNKAKPKTEPTEGVGDGSNQLPSPSKSISHPPTSERMASDESLQKQLTWMQRNLDLLKQENSVLERAASGQGHPMYSMPSRPAPQASLPTRPTSPSFAFSNYKIEMATLRGEMSRINSQLEMCELGRKSFTERWVNRLQTSFTEVNTSLKQLISKSLDNPVESAMTESLKGRLKAAEKRLKLSRKDMLETLSSVEESLLSENSQYKISEADVRMNLRQKTDQLQSIRRKHQSLMEMFQGLKLRSAENGIIDIKDVLRKYSIEDLDGKVAETSGVADASIMEEVKKEHKKQVGMLLKEKALLSSEMGELSDEIHLNKMENQKLKKSLSDLNNEWRREIDEFKLNQNAVLQGVLGQVEAFRKEAEGLCQCDRQALKAVKVLEDTVDTQERLLTAVTSELDQLNAAPPAPPTNQKPSLTAASTQTQDAQPEKKEAKSPVQNSNFRAILDFMKLRSTDEASNKPLVTEIKSEPASPVVDVQELQAKISKLEVELEYAEKNLSFQKEQSTKLQDQVSGYQDDLRKKGQVVEMVENNERDLKRELASYKQVLKELQEDLAEKDKELKLMQNDKSSVQRLLERDRMNVDGKGTTGDERTADINFIKQALELDMMSSRNKLEASLKENNHLKLSLDQAIRELANERDLTSAATYDKMMLQQQLYTTEQERDKEAKEKERLANENALLQLENKKLNSSLQASHNSSLSSASAADKQLRNNAKKLSAELEQTKAQLEAKEKELVFLQDTLKFMLKGANSKDSPGTSSAS